MSIPGYRIIRRICQGGMATVYLAEQESVGREVALKILSPALLQDPNFSQRFLREARFVAKLVHPHIVSLFDLGEHEGELYIAMEYLPGATLRERIRQGMGLPEALRVLRQLASALACSHREGIIHRDVKPDNVLFRTDGSAVLTDFGIATVRDNGMTMTQMGLAVGTPNYMSPEQAQGKKVDHRADLYSLGVLLYEMLTGTVPYSGEDPISIGIQHLTAPIPRLPAPHQLAQPLLQRLMAKLPDERFQSAEELVAAIESLELALLHGSAHISGQQVLAMLNALTATARAWLSQRLGPRQAAPARASTTASTAQHTIARLPAPPRSVSRYWLAPGLAAGITLGTGVAWWLQQPSSVNAVAPDTATEEASTPIVLEATGLAETADTSGEAPSTGDPATALPPTDFHLTIETEPAKARIKLLGIKQKYGPDLRLPPGKYRVEVSAPGYQTQRKTLEITSADLSERIALKSLAELYPVGLAFSDGDNAPQMVVVPARGTPGKPGFAISKYEITFAEFNAYAKAAGITPAFIPPAGMQRWPATGITWQQAQGYARWLSGKTGHSYRIPTGGEWQHAASGGTASRYWWGDTARSGVANCRFGCGDGLQKLFKATTQQVGSYSPNAYGLYDTAGNVAEWTSDCFYEDTSGGSCGVRTVRGGSYNDNVSALATDQRSGVATDDIQPSIGFRVVRELD